MGQSVLSSSTTVNLTKNYGDKVYAMQRKHHLYELEAAKKKAYPDEYRALI